MEALAASFTKRSSSRPFLYKYVTQSLQKPFYFLPTSDWLTDTLIFEDYAHFQKQTNKKKKQPEPDSSFLRPGNLEPE